MPVTTATIMRSLPVLQFLDYKKVSESIQTNDIYVDDIVKETLGSYTATTLDLVKVRSEIVKKIQEKYNTKAVVEISLKDPLIA